MSGGAGVDVAVAVDLGIGVGLGLAVDLGIGAGAGGGVGVTKGTVTCVEIGICVGSVLLEHATSPRTEIMMAVAR